MKIFNIPVSKRIVCNHLHICVSKMKNQNIPLSEYGLPKIVNITQRIDNAVNDVQNIVCNMYCIPEFRLQQQP